MRQFSSPQSIRHHVGFIPFWIVIRHGSKRTVRWWIVAPYSRTTCAAQWLLLYRRFQLYPQIYIKSTMSLKAYCCALTFCLIYMYKYYCTIQPFTNILFKYIPSGQPGSRQCSEVLLSGQIRAVAGGSGSKRFSRDTSESGCCGGSGQAELDEEGLKEKELMKMA